MQIEHSWYASLFLALAVIGLVSIYLRWRLHGHLRDRHRTQWEALDSPSGMTGPFRSIAELRFLWCSSYRSLDDRYLNWLALALKVFEPLFFLLLLCSFAAGLAAVILGVRS